MASSIPIIEVLGNFSIDERGNYQNDSSQRRFLVETVNDHLNSDLHDGYIAQELCGTRSASLSSVQDWIHDNMEGLTKKNILQTETGGTRKLDVDFVGSADVFSLLLRAGESIGGLAILVRRCNGTYYIESGPSKTPPRKQVAPSPAPAPAPQQLFNPRLKCSGGGPVDRARARRSSKESNRTRYSGRFPSGRTSTGSSATTSERNEQREMQYAEKKFAMSITSTDGGVPRADEPVNANAKYVVVMKTQFGDHSFILSNEVQAARTDSNQTPQGNYLCIRTRKAHLVGKPLDEFKRYNLLEWWSEAFITGTPKVLCGMTDDSEHVTSVNTYEVTEIPKLTVRLWDPSICRKMFKAYLSDIKKLIKDDNPRVVYRLELPDVMKGKGIKDRLQQRKFICHQPTEDDSVILTDQYRRGVLNIQDNN